MEPALSFDVAFVLVLVVVAFATAVKTTLGFGFPLIAVPIAANLIGARTAVVLIAIPVMFSNLLILLRGRGTAEEFRQFWSMLAAVIIGTVIGAQFLGVLDPALLSLLLGVTTVAFAIVALVGGLPVVSRRAQTYAGPLVGLAAGVMGGVTGI
ncbi:MAG: TSUP family transporter, partial [bacterium]